MHFLPQVFSREKLQVLKSLIFYGNSQHLFWFYLKYFDEKITTFKITGFYGNKWIRYAQNVNVARFARNVEWDFFFVIFKQRDDDDETFLIQIFLLPPF